MPVSNTSTKRRKYHTIYFPGKDGYEALRFTIAVRLIALIRHNLEHDQIVTKRNLYYQDVELFGDQQRVNMVLDQFAAILGVTLADFNIVASAKGQFHGNVAIFCKDETMMECSENSPVSQFIDGMFMNRINISQPFLIPVAPILYTRVHESVEKIIIVEKEAVFKSLCGKIPNSILITGKGFPDEATQRFVYEVATNNPPLKVYGLVDSDLYGLRIFITYCFGSERANRNRNGRSLSLGVERMEFLGVSLLDYANGWISVTNRDRHEGFRMFNKAWIDDEKKYKIKRELQLGLFLGKKAEMNVLESEFAENVICYLRGKLDEYENR